MVHKKMTITAAGAQNYRTRALTAGDPVTLSASDARLFAKIGWAEEPRRKAKRPQLDHDDNGREGGSITAAGDGGLAALRAEYQAKFDKRPFNGWDATTLREKIAAA
jgi:hypothetical protein